MATADIIWSSGTAMAWIRFANLIPRALLLGTDLEKSVEKLNAPAENDGE